MFGSSGGQVSHDEASVERPQAAEASSPSSSTDGGEKSADSPTSSPPDKTPADDGHAGNEKKRRGNSVSKAKDIFSKAKQSLDIGQQSQGASAAGDRSSVNSLSKLGKTDPALSVPQGSLNNSAGESVPGPRSTFKVGVTEDKNKKCRRTMEDTHAYLYNFLSTPAPALSSDSGSKLSVVESGSTASEPSSQQVVESDNGYFAIFDGHAGTFAADWCGKKLHVLLEETIRKNPNTPVPELLDQTFTQVDQQLEKLPLKNSGCTAVTAVLRWEDRVPSTQSATGSAFFAPAAAAAVKAASEGQPKPAPSSAEDDSITPTQTSAVEKPPADAASSESKPDIAAAQESKLRESASRQRVLYTANVGDARIVLCRNGRALRLSYDHKGSDENEGRRVANAGGLILNNRVNGVLAVTRALGDAYMKDLVTGHPYTTETVIQPDQDEFLILACDGLWDVCSDQEAVDLVRNTHDPQAASKQLVDHALARFSTDNLSCMIVRFDNKALKQRRAESTIGVDGEENSRVSVASRASGISEADAIVSQARKSMSEGGGVPVGPAENADDTAPLGRVEEGAELGEPGPELNPTALEKKQKAVEEKQKQGEIPPGGS